MKHESPIDGVTVTPLPLIQTPKGTLMHMLRCDEAGFCRFGEVYFSEILPGVVKAWKRHKLQTQNFVVPTGDVRIALLDLRESSPTQGRMEIFDLGRTKEYFRLSIPPMIHYGFQCLGGQPAMVANCTDIPHDPVEGEIFSEDVVGVRFPAA